ENDRYEVRLLDASAGVRTILRGDPVGEPITDEHFRIFLTEQGGGDVPVNARMIENLRESTPHERFPALAQLRCDAAGNLWIEEFSPPGARARRLASIAPDGRLRGALALPASATLLHADGERLVTLVRDESDVELVEVRRLVRQ